jgi:hypothetical protein
MVSSHITIDLPLKRKEELTRIALLYGLSLQEFTRHVLERITTSMPEESLSEYAHPERIRRSLKNALKEWQSGKAADKLL